MVKNFSSFNEVAKNHKNYKQHNRLKWWNIRYKTLYNENLAPDRPLISYPNFLLLLTYFYRHFEGNCSYLWRAIYLFYYHFFVLYTQLNRVHLKFVFCIFSAYIIKYVLWILLRAFPSITTVPVPFLSIYLLVYLGAMPDSILNYLVERQ